MLLQNQDQDNEPLCCCEYFDRNNERYHILECCCNCVDFDEAFDRFICCKRIEENNKTGMLLTFQDRLRIPWSGGAKQLSIDAIIPAFIIPMVIGVAAINFYCALAMCIITPAFLGYSYYYLKRVIPRTKFFFMWTIWSVIYLLFLFESTVPLLELLPEENYILILLLCISLFCLYKTRKNAKSNFIVHNTNRSEDDLPDIIEEEGETENNDTEQTSLIIENVNDDINEYNDNHHHRNFHHQHHNSSSVSTSNICQTCRKYVPLRTFHCGICQACIKRRDHHSYWLDCCVGESNHRYYIFGLLFGLFALLFGSNLTLTSVCHPFLIFKIFEIPILLPDDCSEVFDQYEMGISFIISIYSLLIAVFILIALIMQSYLISKGLTLTEWRNGKTANRKPVCWNWRSFIC